MMSLTDIFFALSKTDDILSFEYLQSHQKQAWFCLLAQIAGMLPQEPDDVEAWRRDLIELSNGIVGAWALTNADLSEPAFLQSPVPEGTVDGWRDDIRYPDVLDILITSKNHDQKMARMARPNPEHWIYALVNLQTQEGFLGRGNYGIARMNGGFANRTMVELTPSKSWGGRFRFAVQILRSRFGDEVGQRLLWLPPWSGEKSESIAIQDCHALFVEICRRIRFVDGLSCLRTNTNGPRIDIPKELNGVTEDPWSPIVQGKSTKALTLSADGFSYKLMREVLSGDDYRHSVSNEPAILKRAGYLHGVGLARGQGKTDGFHERYIPIPAGKSSLFGIGAPLHKRSKTWASLASQAKVEVLYPSLRQLLTNGEGGKVESDRYVKWGHVFENKVDDAFFPALWDTAELDEKQANATWRNTLKQFANEVFDDAERSLPTSTARGWKARSAAQNIFGARIKKILDPVGEQTND